jgi:hypothetical protein
MDLASGIVRCISGSGTVVRWRLRNVGMRMTRDRAVDAVTASVEGDGVVAATSTTIRCGARYLEIAQRVKVGWAFGSVQVVPACTACEVLCVIFLVYSGDEVFAFFGVASCVRILDSMNRSAEELTKEAEARPAQTLGRRKWEAA